MLVRDISMNYWCMRELKRCVTPLLLLGSTRRFRYLQHTTKYFLIAALCETSSMHGGYRPFKANDNKRGNFHNNRFAFPIWYFVMERGKNIYETAHIKIYSDVKMFTHEMQ